MTASHKLSSQLYALKPGWNDTQSFWSRRQGKPVHKLASSVGDTPAYDLGWLIRKLPQYSGVYRNGHRILGEFRGDYYGNSTTKSAFEYGDTPENAACALLILLIKNGVL